MKDMSDSMFRGLQRFYDNPKFRPEVVQYVSFAAKSLCQWVRAVYEFCLVYRALEPKRQQLAKAEAELEKVMLNGGVLVSHSPFYFLFIFFLLLFVFFPRFLVRWILV